MKGISDLLYYFIKKTDSADAEPVKKVIKKSIFRVVLLEFR